VNYKIKKQYGEVLIVKLYKGRMNIGKKREAKEKKNICDEK
jgi:hypothetical protein